jgi:Ger(x)C family germination protein
MNRKLRILLLAIIVFWLPGCSDRLDLENMTLGLIVGMDLNQHNELVVYISSPVFSKEAKEKSQKIRVKATTLRQSRAGLDSISAGLITGGKTQILLIGKRLLQHGDWFPLLDAEYRDTKNSLTVKVAAVDGEVSKILALPLKDKPRLPLYLTDLIDNAAKRNLTTRTTLQLLHRQMYEKGLTPYLPEFKIEKKEIKLMGTALLDKRGKLVATLNHQESGLLRILQSGKKGQFSFTVPIPGEQKDDTTGKNKLSFSVSSVKSKTKTSYHNDHFQFNMNLKMVIVLTERLFPFDMKKNQKKLEQQIQEQVQKQMEQLIKKCQRHLIDPIGLGLYARAYQYEEWQKVQEHWGDALAKSDVKISVKTEIKYMGAVK